MVLADGAHAVNQDLPMPIDPSPVLGKEELTVRRTTQRSLCVPPFPPDLDCNDIEEAHFPVLPPDPHGLDGNGDGIGCER